MITVVCSSQYPLEDFKEHVIKTSGLHNKIEFLGYENKGQFSLTEIYNRGLVDAKYNTVVFLHNDITIETKQWGNKLLKQFEKNPETGIIGVAGSKSLPSSGKWWENPKKMYGRVAHTHEGKTWLSTYSDDLGQRVEDAVIVDGVFFAVDKRRIKANFDESVEGFHFYELTFCLDNYLKGVKVGVTTMVRVNHQSIGVTNQQWENNRVNFANNYANNLPINIKRVLHKGDKLKVLISCLNFNNYTGSELYVYELAKQLVSEGCEVSICSTIGNPLALAASQLGIKLYSLQEPPGFKLGDGKWVLQTNEGEVVSSPQMLYKLNEVNFDVIHLNHKPVTKHILRLYPDTPMVTTIHSEVINLEDPVIHDSIKKFIAIRPEIKEYIVDKFNVDEKLVDVIYNPIDASRFKIIQNTDKRDKKRILFVGTIDYLRKNTISDLITTTGEMGQELWIVGKKNDTYLDSMIENQLHVTYFDATNNVEQYIQQCDETAGILLGRTTIEGWMCGKAGWIYDVSSNGDVLSKKLHDIPSDIDKFKSENIVKEIMEIYKSIIE